MACVDACSHKVLKPKIDENGFYKIECDNGRCINCGLCTKVCPVLNIIKKENDNPNLSFPYATWCTDERLRDISASGGAFAAIAKLFLQMGAVVYGAAIKGFDVCHLRVDNIEDLPILLGSKYQHSRMDTIYRKVKKDLRDGRVVLFSGLSCQVAAIIKFVGNNLQDRLYTVDTICGGLSTMLPIIHKRQQHIYKSIHSFRNKDLGWRSTGYKYSLKMVGNEGQIVDLGPNDIMLQCFRHKETKRLSCLDCQFNGFHRRSDVTIGDFWGDTRFNDQHERGLSVLIVHSPRIKEYLFKSPLHMEVISWSELVKSNPSLYWSHYPYMRYSLMRKLVFNKLRLNEEADALKLFEKSYLRYIEIYILNRINERRRLDYLKTKLEIIENENSFINNMA